MADARIVIDTKIRKDQALKDLALLQKDAKSTAAEIAKLDQKLAAAKSDTKLADNLRQAQKAAADTAAELDRVNAKLEAAKQTELAKIKATPGFQNFKPSTLSDMAETDAMLNNPEAVKQSEALAATLLRQETAVRSAKAALDTHTQSTQHMATAQQVLRERLDGLNAAMGTQQIKVRAASAMSSFVQGISSFASKAHRSVSRLSDGFKRLASHVKLGGKSMGHFGSRLREIALGALIFNGISKALRSFVTGMNNALTKSGAFTSALSNLKGAALNAAAPLVSALTPALTAIANAAAIALSYIGRLFAFFSGKSIASLKSTAKAMGGVATGTNAAKKALAGFDTINTLDTSSGSGGGSASPPNLAYEASNPFLDSLTEAIKGGDWAGAGTMLADKLNSIIAGWDAYGWGQKLGGMLQNGISFAFNFLTKFDWNSLGAKLAEFVNSTLSQVDGAQLGALFAAKFTIAIRMLGTFLANLDWATLGTQLSRFAIGFVDAISDAIRSVDWRKIGEGISDMLASIDWAGIFLALGELLGVAALALYDLLAGLCSDAWEWIKEKFMEGFNKFYTGEGNPEELGVQLITGLLMGIWNVIKGIGIWIYNNIFKPIGDGIADAFDMHSPSRVASGWGENIMLGMLNGLTAIWTKITVWLANIKNGFISVWTDIKNALRPIINGIIGFMNGMISGAVSGMNAVIDTLNHLNVHIPDWIPLFGGKSIGFSLSSITAPQIPYLAQGAVIPPNREFMAVLGDQRSGTNIEAPLETIKQALAEVLAQQGGGDINIKFTGDLSQLARVLQPVIEREQHRRGTRLVKGVV